MKRGNLTLMIDTLYQQCFPLACMLTFHKSSTDEVFFRAVQDMLSWNSPGSLVILVLLSCAQNLVIARPDTKPEGENGTHKVSPYYRLKILTRAFHLMGKHPLNKRALISFDPSSLFKIHNSYIISCVRLGQFRFGQVWFFGSFFNPSNLFPEQNFEMGD